nr:PREDICTED: uncharacterized protein LOC102361117 [Latimeria chalumnae]XP_014350679.1 PREDICTED: uncharacterized protein LOC102361117 [Latimeria chalumnae]XP_014350680.1 PREDICTED: uncharacterized protein LOC102361117 [Latimeria chalumnae]|eukprot:XP_006007088.1 PREDICTED: uncharacterized protein LOC102361117 [Latimeria chalumnae]
MKGTTMTKGKTVKKNDNKTSRSSFAPLSSRLPSPSSSSNEASDLAPLRPDLTGPSENISEDIKTILTSIQRISTTIVEIKQGNADILGRLTSIETHLSDSDRRLTAAEMKIESLTSDVADLHNRLDDQENRAQRNNVRILGFPEDVEQGKPTRFLGEMLPVLLKLPEGTDLVIERAHRSLAPRPAPGQRLRPFIVTLLRFPVKELLLKLARELGTGRGTESCFSPTCLRLFMIAIGYFSR